MCNCPHTADQVADIDSVHIDITDAAMAAPEPEQPQADAVRSSFYKINNEPYEYGEYEVLSAVAALLRNGCPIVNIQWYMRDLTADTETTVDRIGTKHTNSIELNESQLAMLADIRNKYANDDPEVVRDFEQLLGLS